MPFANTFLAQTTQSLTFRAITKQFAKLCRQVLRILGPAQSSAARGP
jgi:hypothetical protein